MRDVTTLMTFRVSVYIFGTDDGRTSHGLARDENMNEQAFSSRPFRGGSENKGHSERETYAGDRSGNYRP